MDQIVLEKNQDLQCMPDIPEQQADYKRLSHQTGILLLAQTVLRLKSVHNGSSQPFVVLWANSLIAERKLVTMRAPETPTRKPVLCQYAPDLIDDRLLRMAYHKIQCPV
jgi:hypothetical protein